MFANSSGVLSPPEAPLHFLLLKLAPEKDSCILIANKWISLRPFPLKLVEQKGLLFGWKGLLVLVPYGIEENLVLFGVSFGAGRSPARAVVLDIIGPLGSPGKVFKIQKSRHQFIPIFYTSLFGGSIQAQPFLKPPGCPAWAAKADNRRASGIYLCASTLYDKTYETIIQSRKWQ